MKKITQFLMLSLLAVFLLGGIFVGSVYATPMYQDYYLHPNDNETKNKDVIGNDTFNILGHSWNDGHTLLTIETHWDKGLSGANDVDSMLGDVFLYENGEIKYGIALRNHGVNGSGANSDRVESTEGEDGILQGDIFSIEGFRYSDDYYSDKPTNWYGDHEIVTGWTTTEKLGSVSLSYSSGVNIGITFSDNKYYSEYIRFTETCGNDVHAPVPEPATMLLFGSGLIGLAGLGRRRFLKRA